MPGCYGLAEMSLPQPVPGIGVVWLLFGLAMAEAMIFLVHAADQAALSSSKRSGLPEYLLR